MSGLEIKNLDSGQNTDISILLYIQQSVNIDTEIKNITAGQKVDIKINKYFQNSPDFQKLEESLSMQKDKVSQLQQQNDKSYRTEKIKLEGLEKATVLFKTNALRLAETFLKLPVETERLTKARDLFEKGLISEADAALAESDLMDDQNTLIAQMNYFRQRAEDLKK